MELSRGYSSKNNINSTIATINLQNVAQFSVTKIKGPQNISNYKNDSLTFDSIHIKKMYLKRRDGTA